VTATAFLKDDKTLAVAGGDGAVRLVEARKERDAAGDVAVRKDQGEVLSLALSPDGSTLAWSNAAGKVRLADVEKFRKDDAVEKT